MKRFDGKKDPERRVFAEEHGAIPTLAYETMTIAASEYRKTATIYAARMEEPFVVVTLEGVMEGKAGDFLALGVAGELYPIDAAVMAASYEKVDD